MEKYNRNVSVEKHTKILMLHYKVFINVYYYEEYMDVLVERTRDSCVKHCCERSWLRTWVAFWLVPFTRFALQGLSARFGHQERSLLKVKQ